MLWSAYERCRRSLTATQARSLSKKERLDILVGLAKTESALATNIEKIGFAQFVRRQGHHLSGLRLWMALVDG